MDKDEVIKKLERFACKDKWRTKILGVYVKGDRAYATDGAIAVVHDVDNDNKSDKIDDILAMQGDEREYPTDKIDDILAMSDSHGVRFSIDKGQYEMAADEFLRKCSDERYNLVSANAKRYVRTECPGCGEELYWDSESNRLVREYPDVDLDDRDVSMPVMIDFGDSGCVPVSFAYVYLVYGAFGPDIEVWPCKDKNGDRMLAMSGSDGKATCVLMSLRLNYGYLPDCKLVTARIK